MYVLLTGVYTGTPHKHTVWVSCRRTCGSTRTSQYTHIPVHETHETHTPLHAHAHHSTGSLHTRVRGMKTHCGKFRLVPGRNFRRRCPPGLKPRHLFGATPRAPPTPRLAPAPPTSTYHHRPVLLVVAATTCPAVELACVVVSESVDLVLLLYLECNQQASMLATTMVVRTCHDLRRHMVEEKMCDGTEGAMARRPQGGGLERRGVERKEVRTQSRHSSKCVLVRARARCRRCRRPMRRSCTSEVEWTKICGWS